jgi:hypothetical protein
VIGQASREPGPGMVVSRTSAMTMIGFFIGMATCHAKQTGQEQRMAYASLVDVALANEQPR